MVLSHSTVEIWKHTERWRYGGILNSEDTDSLESSEMTLSVSLGIFLHKRQNVHSIQNQEGCVLAGRLCKSNTQWTVFQGPGTWPEFPRPTISNTLTQTKERQGHSLLKDKTFIFPSHFHSQVRGAIKWGFSDEIFMQSQGHAFQNVPFLLILFFGLLPDRHLPGYGRRELLGRRVNSCKPLGDWGGSEWACLPDVSSYLSAT